MPKELEIETDVEELAIVITPEVQKRFDEIITQIRDEIDEKRIEQIEKAFHFAANAHSGQTRISGDPYITHPLEVMGILTELHVDSVTLIGALLHDIVEDTGSTLDDVAQEFGPVVALLVEGMTKLSALRYDTRSSEERQAEYFRKMLLSMAQDLRVVMIKFADRLHNMRTLEVMPIKSQIRIAQETLDIYAPLAHRFGVGKIKWQLEDLSLRILDKVAYRRIAERVTMDRDERENALNNVIEQLKIHLKSEGINAEVLGRAKHFFSIYNKINRRGKSFEEILDLLAVRIIVADIPDCYKALGVAHNLFTPIVERFSDYIAMPKGNMYQSLHTKVMDKEGHTIEVQIRTREMDEIAEVGIAAHWRYKEGKSSRIIREDNLKDYYRWLRQVIEGSKEEDSSEEFMQTLKINLFTDEIYVFTPKGKLIRLPKESSPVDFAFAVHSDVGLKTLGSKVNGKMVPLNTRLFNGDSVEILTSANAHPSADWLRFVNSSKARSKIKRYFKQTQFEDSIRIGEELLQRELKANKLKMSRKEILDLVNGAGHESPESFYAAVGAGDLSVKRVLKDVIGEVTQTIEKRNAARQSLMRTLKRDTSNVRVKGADNLMIAFGNCCSPLPGDRIIGYLSKGRGIVVHRNDCPNIADLSKDPEKLVDVDWDVHGGSLFNCRLRIYGEDRNNLLKDMADVFSKMKVSVVELNLRSEGSLAVGTLVVQVKGLGQLSRLMNRVSKIQNIVKVERINVADVAEKIV